MLWGYSLQFWQTVVFWLWFVAAATGAVAVAASFGSSVISYYISDETQRAADKDIARANSSAGTANERAAKLEVRAEELRLKSIETERFLEKERIERLELQKRVAWRSITPEQSKSLADSSKTIDFDFWIMGVKDDPEAFLYFEQIYEPFRPIQKRVHYFSGLAIAFGVFLHTKDEAKAKVILAMFREAQIAVEWLNEDPPLKMGADDFAPQLIIGMREPLAPHERR